MKIYLQYFYDDEDFLSYSITTADGEDAVAVDVPEDTVTWWKKVSADRARVKCQYDQMQAEMATVLQSQYFKNPDRYPQSPQVPVDHYDRSHWPPVIFKEREIPSSETPLLSEEINTFSLPIDKWNVPFPNPK